MALSTTGAQAATASPNLVADPYFHLQRHAWVLTPAGRMWVTHDAGGLRILGVRNAAGVPRTIRLSDRVDTVAHTVAGRVYAASAWVRVTRPGTTGEVRQWARRGGTAHDAARVGAMRLRDTAWHRVFVRYTARYTGDSIDFSVAARLLPPGVHFFIRRPRLVLLPPVATVAATPPPTVVAASPAPTSSSSAPKLVFDDEFNGTSVDTKKWNVRNNTYSGNEESIDLARNVTEGNGVLTIEARKQTYTVGSTTRNYTSGYLDTIGLSGFQYGRWEMRAKLPNAKGMWPAFWLRGDHSSGEVDIMEAIGGMPTFCAQTVFPNTMDGSVKRSHNYYLPSGDITGWHVYGFVWSPGKMSWLVDGVTVFTVTSNDVSWISTAFDTTVNIRLNLQVGGAMPNWWGQPVDSSTTFPADYQIDWVRVYNG